MQGRGPGGPLGTLSHSCPETHLSVGHRHTEASLAQVVGWEVGKQFAESQCFRQGASGNNNRITTRYHCHGHEKRESNAYRLSGKGRKVQARKTKVAKTQTPRQTGGGAFCHWGKSSPSTGPRGSHREDPARGPWRGGCPVSPSPSARTWTHGPHSSHGEARARKATPSARTPPRAPTDTEPSPPSAGKATGRLSTGDKDKSPQRTLKDLFKICMLPTSQGSSPQKGRK